jgi:tripartite-type tricarboxylate transporter receptor subunit TctC
MRILNLFLRAHLVAALLLIVPAGVLHAQPANQVITLVVPFPAGGTGDTFARLIGQHLSSRLGKVVVVDNKPGASTVIGSEAVVRSKPDGNTLLLASSSLTTLPATNPASLRFDPLKDLTLITKAVQLPLVIAVRSDAPFRSVAEMIAFAKANPGKLNVGVSPGLGSSAHLAFERFKVESRIDATAVPYKGTAPAVQALLSGEVMVIIDAVAGTIPQVDAGKARALAVMSDRRMSGVPNIPTVAESGLPGFEADTWMGFAAPARLPADLVKRLHEELAAIMALPDVRSKVISLGMEPVMNTPEEFRKVWLENVASWKKVASEANVKFTE